MALSAGTRPRGSTSVRAGSSFDPSRVGMMAETHFRPSKYDVAADGRFPIAVQASDEPPPPLVLVLNWAEALKPRS